jgi:transposase
LSWAEVEPMSDDEVERRLFPRAQAPAPTRPTPQWAEVHSELKRKGVTLQLLWEEYTEDHPEGYRYSQFCELYRRWRGTVDLSMRQVHRAGEKCFVDYAGPTVDVINPRTGEVREAQIFVAVLGASNYTYAEATWTQGLEDWIGAHVRAYEHFCGVPEITVPDNPRTSVIRACRYEPELNPTYQDMAVHYGTAVIPARVRRPRDKPKVEVGVQVVERWILARLRKQKFFSLAELNQTIAELLEQLNDRPFNKLPGSRRSQYESLDRPALKRLPATRFEYADWKTVRVHIDYHVEVDEHYYSVPYQLVGKQLEARFTTTTVEVLHKGRRVASHLRSFHKGGHTTVREHMPKTHQAQAEWTPKRLVRWALRSGPSVAQLVSEVMESRPHPQQGFRSCLGIMRLGDRFGADRLEAACARALATGAVSYRSIKSILLKGLDRQPVPGQQVPESEPIEHDNVRGAAYYATGGE